MIAKPIQMTKQEGVKGTFKGIGQGAFGLLSTPFTATLRLGSSITGGVS